MHLKGIITHFQKIGFVHYAMKYYFQILEFEAEVFSDISAELASFGTF